MNILDSKRFKQAEVEGGYFVLEPTFVRKAIEGGVGFGTTQFFVYLYLRRREAFDKHGSYVSKKHIAEHIGATEKEVDNALQFLKEQGLIRFADIVEAKNI